jgi:hypothetical protein
MKVYHFNVNFQKLPIDYYAGQNLLFPFPSIWTTYLFGEESDVGYEELEQVRHFLTLHQCWKVSHVQV